MPPITLQPQILGTRIRIVELDGDAANPLSQEAHKIGDLAGSGELGLLTEWDLESGLFWLEMIGFVALPMVLFSLPAVRQSSAGLLFSALLVISGVILSRFAVSLIAIGRPEFAASYVPHPLEFAVTIGIVAAGVTAFGLVARYLPLFTEYAPSQAGE